MVLSCVARERQQPFGTLTGLFLIFHQSHKRLAISRLLLVRASFGPGERVWLQIECLPVLSDGRLLSDDYVLWRRMEGASELQTEDENWPSTNHSNGPYEKGPG